jgi:hypothetical protein
MKINSKQTVLFLFVIIITATLLNACATLQLKAPDEVLRERAEGLMNAKMNNDWGEVYEYFDSSYRKSKSKENFVKINREMHLLKYAIDSIEIDPSGEEATVKVRYDVNLKIFEFNDILDTQQWIKQGSNWYIQIKN